MLKRMQLRRYLHALLYHKMIQSPLCEVGFLYQNCNGQAPPIYDSPTQQIFENVEDSYSLKTDDMAIAFHIVSENYQLSKTEIESNKLTFAIDLIVNASSGAKRQNILDKVQERILYRILSYQKFTDESTGDTLNSFLTWADNLTINVSDDTDYDGSYTVRQLTFNVTTNECIKRTDCDLESICFDFSQLDKIGKCNG